MKDPFEYLTPDCIDAKSALSLFVDVFKDYNQVLNVGNTFIHGPRGSGKSMMFRIMAPDCQMLKEKSDIKHIPFYSFYIPIKNTNFDISEMSILEAKHGGSILNEHFLVINIANNIFKSLSAEDFSEYKYAIENLKEVYENIKIILGKTGYIVENKNLSFSSINDYFIQLSKVCDDLHSEFVNNYLWKILLGDENLPYNGPLCLYSNFLLPAIKLIKTLPFMPEAPIYILIDDADELNYTQVKILNSWVSYRTSADVCFKISTQMHYPTYFTSRGSKIDTPHDYSEITLSEIYTSNKNRYIKNLKEIVKKRLGLYYKKEIDPEDYFPENKDQEQKINELWMKLQESKLKEGMNASEAYDFAYRNARPDYMISLSNQYTYSYAGFQQIAHLSSGIIRNFLDLSSKMYTETYKEKHSFDFDQIPISIQNKEIKNFSENLITSEFDKLLNDEIDTKKLTAHKKLRNFIDALGKSFRVILETHGSERRKFSFYYDGNLSDECIRILKMGVIYGYLHESTLKSKSGLGRSKLYILNRMLAPYYQLDPFSFSGYLHLTTEMIEKGMNNPNAFVRDIKNKNYNYDSPEHNKLQLEFEFEE